MKNILSKLTDRTLFYVQGPDMSKQFPVRLLQNLTTNNIDFFLSSELTGWSTLFLNPQGKILFDTILAKPPHFNSINPGLILDVNLSQKDALLKHIADHSLRKRMSIDPLEGLMEVYSDITPGAVPEAAEGTRNGNVQEEGADEFTGFNSFVDPRSKIIGSRQYMVQGAPKSQESTDVHKYTEQRILQGIGQGKAVEGLYPHSANFQILNSLCFNKKCYIGQEEVAQNYGRGIVRDQVLPFAFGVKSEELSGQSVVDYDFKEELEGQIVKDEAGNVIGQILESHYNIGLILTKSSNIGGNSLQTEEGRNIVLWKPSWLSNL